MKIPPNTSCGNNFGMKFYKNSNFIEVVNYAKNVNKLSELDFALSKLSKVDGSDVVIIHGTNNNSQIYSSFNAGRNSVRNSVAGVDNPAQASLNAILELVDEKNPKLAKLLGYKPKMLTTAEEIVEKYTVK